MNDPFTGGCACGAVRYACGGDPVFSWNCHCRDCQRASGSAFCAVSYVSRATLDSTGEVHYYEVEAESGNRVSRGFCTACGSPVFLLATMVPDLIGIWAASRDDPDRFRPAANVWTTRARAWDVIDDSLPAYPEAPSAEQMQLIIASCA